MNNIIKLRGLSQSHLYSGAAILSLLLIVCNNGYSAISPLARHGAILLGLTLAAGTILGNLHALSKSVVFPFLLFLTCVFLDVTHSKESLFSVHGYWLGSCFIVFLAGFVIGTRPVDSSGNIDRMLTLLSFPSSLLYFVRVRSGGGGASRLAISEDMHPVGIAYSFGFMAVVMVTLVVFSKDRPARLFASVNGVVCIFNMLSSGSRGGLAAFGATMMLIITFFILDRRTKLGFKSFYLLLFASAILGVFLLASAFWGEQVEYVFQRFGSVGADDPSIRERIASWEYLYDRMDNWLLVGLPGYSSLLYPHNLFFELAVRFGMFGVGLALTIHAYVAFGVLRFFTSSLCPYERIAVLVGVFALINGQSNLSIEVNRVLFFSLGAIHACTRRRLGRKLTDDETESWAERNAAKKQVLQQD